MDDLQGIVTLVRACEPFLTAHRSYIYWMNIQYCSETCAVAELDGELVAWCSIIPVPNGNFLLHQLGVAPSARRKGIAESLVAYLLNKLKLQQGAAFELEFTVDRKNRAALDLNRIIAVHAGMHLLKKPGLIGVLEEGCDEELYVMTPDDRGELTLAGPEK